jgi:hypothetical protein
VTLSYRPEGPFRWSVFGGLAALLVIMLIAWAPWRRRSLEPTGPDGMAATRPGAAPGVSGQPDGFPGRTWPAIWGIQAPVAVTGLVLAAFAGLWIGGYPAALLMPAGTAVFLAAAQSRAGSRLARLLASPWLAVGLLAAASVCVVLGTPLTGEARSLLLLSLPQLLCFVVVARLIAALLGEFRAADAAEPARAGAEAGARGSSG